MKKLLLFMFFSLLFFAVGVNVGENEGKSPPGVEMGYYDLQPLAPGVSVEMEKPVCLISFETTIPVDIGLQFYKTEAAVVRRHDRRLWSIYAKEIKSLYAYGHLLYEAKDQESKSVRTTRENKRAFKTEYG